jgi:hypothetical protein
MNTEIATINDIERMSQVVVKSGLFGIKTPDQAMSLMLLCQAEGMSPVIAVRDYHIIQGRPALKADAMLARFQSAGGKVRWTEMNDSRVSGEFSHPQGGTVEIDWTIDMARRANLTKNPTWTQYPRAMLRARCISEGIRTVFPGVVVGTYTPEEAEDMDPQTPQPAAPRDMGPVVEVADFGSVMRQIDAAQTIDALNALRPAIRTLDRDARDEANDAAKVRAGQIRAAQAPVETLEANDEPI